MKYSKIAVLAAALALLAKAPVTSLADFSVSTQSSSTRKVTISNGFSTSIREQAQEDFFQRTQSDGEVRINAGSQKTRFARDIHPNSSRRLLEEREQLFRMLETRTGTFIDISDDVRGAEEVRRGRHSQSDEWQDTFRKQIDWEAGAFPGNFGSDFAVRLKNGSLVDIQVRDGKFLIDRSNDTKLDIRR